MSSKKPRLQGQTIVVTRATADSSALADPLREHGARVICVPVISVSPPEDPEPLRRSLATLEQYDLVVLGSKNAVAALEEHGVRCDTPIACVGRKTADAVSRSGLFTGAQIVPKSYRAEALIEAINERFGLRIAGLRVLFPRGEHGRTHVIEALASLGATVDAVEAYRVSDNVALSDGERASAADADWYTFLSAETLRAFLRIFGEAGRKMLTRGRVAVIGPVARDGAKALGVRVDLCPEEATVESLVAALIAQPS